MATVYDKATGAPVEVHPVDGHELVRKGLYSWDNRVGFSTNEPAMLVEEEPLTVPEPEPLSKKRSRKARS